MLLGIPGRKTIVWGRELHCTVLVNGLHAKTGGGVTYLRNVLPYLAADPELEIHLCLHRDQQGAFEPMDKRVRVHYAGFSGGFYRRLVWEQAVLPIIARRLGADVTFSPANFGPLLAPRPVILLRNALAVWGEDRRPGKRLYWLALSLMTKASLTFCRHAIAVSEYAGAALTRGASRRTLDRVSVVHHGVGEAFTPAKSGHGREDFLLCVGDIYIQKNLHRLIEALDRVREVFPDVRLKVAGRPVDEEYAGLVGALIAEYGLGGNVELLGHVAPEDLLEAYRRCAVLVFPSTVETFGNPLVEAMACGAPIVSANTTAMPEVLGDAALFFDPRNPDQMAECILAALNDADLRRDLSERGLARSKDFSWRRTGERTASILKDCARRR